jgi:hypothetical protein
MTSRFTSLIRVALLAAVLFGSIESILAGGGPEGVAVIVNSESPESTALANEYVHLRRIPISNVIYLKGIPAADKEVSINDFRDKILLPLLQSVEARGLASQIDTIIYSAGFPTTVNFQGDLGDVQPPKEISAGASLTALTYLYQSVLAKAAPAYLGLDTNWYYRKPLPKRQDTAPWTEEETAKFGEIKTLLEEFSRRSSQNIDDKEWAATFRKDLGGLLDDLLKTHPNHQNLLTLRAGQLLLEGKGDEAMGFLQQAYDCGWWNLDQLKNDPMWKTLADRPEYKTLEERMKQPEFTVAPAKGFRGSSGWDSAGKEVAPDKGRRYLLCSMLAVTGIRGNTLNEAVAYVKRGIESDDTCPKGTIYLMRNNDVRSTCREWAYGPTAEALKKLGVKVVITNGVLPQNVADVAGVMTGTSDFDWRKSGSTLLPGAFCDNLTSYGGILTRNSGQTPLTEFLRHGASGASGAVAEPFALQAKFPYAPLQAFYAAGCNLAEAYYQSVSGPYQLLLVGDPLCQPWARRPKINPLGSAIDQPLKGTLNIRPIVTPPPGKAIGLVKLYIDGRVSVVAKSGDPLVLDTKKIDEGNHELRIVAVTDDLVQTQGRYITRINVANKKTRYTVMPPKQIEFTDRDTIEITVQCEGALGHGLFLNGAMLTTANGASAKLSVPARSLGYGPMVLQPVALFDNMGQQKTWGTPFRIRVSPAPKDK